MRIAMITDSYYPTRDGVVTSITITKKALEDMGHEVIVVAPDPGEKHRMDGVLYIGAIKFKSYDGYFIPIKPSKILQELEKLDIDVIHIHGIAVMALRGWHYARKLDKPVVMTFHTMVGDVLEYYSPVSLDPKFLEKWMWKYIRFLLKRMDTVIVPTPGIGRELESKAEGIRLSVIPTGTDVERFHPGIDGSTLRERYNLQGKRIVAHVSRLSYEKNIDLIIRSMKDIDATLVIAGSGPCEKDLKDLVKELSMDDKVLFTGFLDGDDLPMVYGMADVVLSASEFETQGLSILEAMACGVPVVCRDARAFHDIITDGVNGYLFSTPEELPDAILRGLSASEDVRQGGLNTALDNSREKSAERLTTLYNDIIARRHSQ